jgi:hypothetical protein
MQAHEEAAAILIRTLEALARQNRKTLSAATRADLTRACKLLVDGDSYDDLLDDLLSAPPIRSDRTTVNLERPPQWGEPEHFAAWREERHEDERIEDARRMMRR